MGTDLTPEFVPYLTPWEVSRSVNCQKITDDRDGIHIDLSIDSDSVIVSFETREFLAVTEEGFRQKTLDLISGYLPQLIFEVRNSPLMKFLEEEDFDAHSTSALRHFMLVTSEEIIDIISFDLPVFLTGNTTLDSKK